MESACLPWLTRYTTWRGESDGKIGSRSLRMHYDRDKVDEMVLALLFLTITDEDDEGARTWKSQDWGAMDRLHAAGYISDPKSKAKSVWLTPEGLKRSRELFEQHFAVLP